MIRLSAIITLAAFTLPVFASYQRSEGPRLDYLVYVVCESADRIALIRFGPSGIHVERDIPTGAMPSDLDGPHGIVVDRAGQNYYVSLGHGRPFGSVWKYSTADDSVIKRVTLGMFPATMDLTPDGSFLFVVNFNLHGDMVPSSVSVVATDLMMEIARIPTCTMPHGSRLNAEGTRQYSACMMDDLLVEIDTRTLKVARHFLLTGGKEAGFQGAPKTGARQDHSHPTAAHDEKVECSPTWAQPSKDGRKVYVACNSSDEIVEVDVETWKATRRIKARPGVYNLAVTGEGRLVATNKRDQSVSIFRLSDGAELIRIPTSRSVVHGVEISPDDKYAFVSVEGVGNEPGTVEVIDLIALKTVATVDVAEQAAGIDFWKTEPPRRSSPSR